MKVLLINGSPHKEGCTFTALTEIKNQLEKEGVNSEIFWIGNKPVRGCIACLKCGHSNGKCAFDDDPANEIIDKIIGSDAVIVGSPVYYSGPNGALCAILDRVFYASGANFAFKPAASIVSCRRGGASASFDRLNKYFTISNMPVVSSQYWNMVHGNTPEEVKQDLEGLQIMRTLARNMAWILNSIENNDLPNQEEKVKTNFIG
ncbi:flavodoxin family protein [Methanobrevibacter olleyae]|uniref:Multimeric flavodoxin WrbA n=1 Tax=Methanobrevibacter olleyae TaxID=294671 RepID=A0A126QZV0_METOL|nr:flavodoxin family protein [Methanobrevibacter olleyae]AMK15643.1 NADPH-dependent FMN reductase [Methanobrevibacter olleyae]SFL24082.1 Multimeric flavodoxin WrbA [Methanobrevibacter olleyae]